MTLRTVLEEIYSKYGEDVFRNSYRLYSAFSESAPQLKNEKRLLKSFLECSGNTCILDAKGKPLAEQKSVIKAIVQEMHADQNIPESVAQSICNDFYSVVNGGRTIPQGGGQKPEPRPTPVPGGAQKEKTQKQRTMILAAVIITAIVLLVPYILRINGHVKAPTPKGTPVAQTQSQSSTTFPGLTYKQPLTGTLLEGLTWGSNQHEVKELLSKKGIIIDSRDMDDTSITYLDDNGFDFAPGIVGTFMSFHFCDNKLCLFSVSVHTNSSEAKLIKWRKALSELYGEYHEYNIEDATRQALLYNAFGQLDEDGIVTDEELLNYYIMNNFFDYNNQINTIAWNLSDGTLTTLYDHYFTSIYYYAPYELFSKQ